MIPKPRFLQKQIQDVKIGTFQRVATVQETATVYDALSVFVERRVSALPVVNEQGIYTHTANYLLFLNDKISLNVHYIVLK